MLRIILASILCFQAATISAEEECGGKVCLNYGGLDLSTCTCQCPSIYTGDLCETLSCNYQQESWCDMDFDYDPCKTFTNAAYECHMLCGTCPYPCNGKKCANGGTLNTETCSCS